MTQQRDLKRRIRDRMAKTGESYVTARLHVLADRPEPAPEPAPDSRVPAFEVVETIDISDDAFALGLRCRAGMFPKLAALVDAPTALVRLRDALVGTENDDQLTVMRRLVLYGERAPSMRHEFAQSGRLRGFIERVRAGIGGVSPGGGMLALTVRDVMMICAAAVTRLDEPIVYLHGVDEISARINFIGLRR